MYIIMDVLHRYWCAETDHWITCKVLATAYTRDTLPGEVDGLFLETEGGELCYATPAPNSDIQAGAIQL